MSEDESSFDPIAARGVGAAVFTEPSLFFLTHETIITSWANLQLSAAADIDAWFETEVHDGLASVAEATGMVLSRVERAGAWRHLLLHPAETPFVDREPVIGVGLGWSRKRVNPVSNGPFACVYTGSTVLARMAGTLFLDAGGRQVCEDWGHSASADRDWPVWWTVRAPDEKWWADLDGYLTTLVAETTSVMQSFENSLRIAVESLRAETQPEP
jgi:hypothetical protein